MHGGKSEWAEGAVRTGGPISGGLLELVGAGRAESSWGLVRLWATAEDRAGRVACRVVSRAMGAEWGLRGHVMAARLKQQ